MKVDQNGLNWIKIEQNAMLMWLNKIMITMNVKFHLLVFLYKCKCRLLFFPLPWVVLLINLDLMR